MKRVAIFGLAGAVAFSMLSTWLGPKMIGWYVTPADQPAALSCQAAVVGAMHRLVQTQMIGTLIGVVVGLALAFVFRKKEAPAAPAARAPPAAPPAAKA
jgi:ABC-type phosphate/phosphonate transport system permease subunit